MSTKHFDILIRAGELLSMAGPKPARGKSFLRQKDFGVGITNGIIVDVGPWSEFSKKTESHTVAEFIDASGHIVMPGLINGHGHLPMTLFRGLADDLPFADWLNKFIIPLEARLVSPEFVRLGTRLACLESVSCGVTTVTDMYYFETDIAAACDKSGIRAILGETVFDFAAPDNKNKNGSDYAIAKDLVDQYANHSRIKVTLAPHAPYTCSDDTLKKARDFCQKHSLAMQIHVSETRGEVEGSLKEYKKTPLQRLDNLGLTDLPLIMAHCVHLTDEEIEIAAKKNCAVVYNPESNMKLGSGVAPIPKMISSGVKISIGTDGPASNNNLSLFTEMDAGAKLQKLAQNDNTALTATEALWIATRGGADALGLENLGSIEKGNKADLITVNLNLPHMQPLHDPAAQLVYSASGSEVDDVIVEGKILKRGGKLVDRSAGDLFAEIEEYRKRMNF